MVDPRDAADLPNLEDFARRVEEATASAEKFSESIGANTPSTPVAAQQGGGQPMDMSIFRDILSALSMIHDDTTAIREALQQITES